jgi:hypothetical protein
MKYFNRSKLFAIFCGTREDAWTIVVLTKVYYFWWNMKLFENALPLPMLNAMFHHIQLNIYNLFKISSKIPYTILWCENDHINEKNVIFILLCKSFEWNPTMLPFHKLFVFESPLEFQFTIPPQTITTNIHNN